MASDLYEALISGGAGNKAEVIANALRRRREMGELGVLTGDKVLSQLGGNLTKSADDYADQLERSRQDTRRQDQTQFYQQGQLDHMGALLDETKRRNDMDHIYKMLMAQAALDRANRPGGGGRIPKLRQGDIKELQDLGETIGTIDSVENFLRGGGSFGAVTLDVGGKELPLLGLRTFKNFAASKGLGTPEDKASFQAKQHWERLYNIAERNRMFGATLTTNEKKSWDQANPSVGMTDEQIAAALPVMRKVYEHRLNRKASGLIKEGYSAEAVADYADVPGINLPLAVGGDQEMDAARGGAAPPAAPTGAGKRLKKVNGKWVPVDGL